MKQPVPQLLWRQLRAHFHRHNHIKRGLDVRNQWQQVCLELLLHSQVHKLWEILVRNDAVAARGR